MKAVALERASLVLGARMVLRDVSFGIEPGEFVGVLGPNGAGKTTLLRALLGLVRPMAGTVRVFGAEAAPRPGVGYVPQARPSAAGLGLAGWELVVGAAGPRWGWPWPGRAARADAEWALDQVDATELARRRLDELSGGERQRVLLAQALLGRPRLLLLDEPLISLDPKHQAAVVALVRHLRDTLGLTVLFTAHELNPLLGAIDRVLFLGNERTALGTVEEVATAETLSALYDTEIDVVHSGGRVFVLPGGDGCHHHHDE